MGATGWTYLREFDGDPQRLLTALHEHVYAERKFQFPSMDTSFLDDLEFFTVSADERRELAESYGLDPILRLAERVGLDGVLPWLEERSRDKTVTSFDELRALQCLSWDGTHSPLDIHEVSESPKNSHLFPLPEPERVAVFGTQRVQFEDVVNRTYIIGERRPEAYERWQAVYVPVFSGERLTHAYVEGASGD